MWKSKLITVPGGIRGESRDMKLIELLEILKSRGITKLSGMYGENNINKYIENAVRCHEDSIRWADVPCHKYSLEHEDDHYIIETNGHYIIATHYGNFDMATYGDYDTEEEMRADFDEWQIMKEAKAIADEKVAKGSEMPHAAWVLIAVHELRKCRTEAHAAFEREFACTN